MREGAAGMVFLVDTEGATNRHVICADGQEGLVFLTQIAV
jgi:hypothetical protein